MSITQAFRGGHDNRPGWYIAFTFNQDIIDALKRRVPSCDRRWDPERGLWFVAKEHEDVVLELLPGFAAYLAQPALF